LDHAPKKARGLCFRNARPDRADGQSGTARVSAPQVCLIRNNNKKFTVCTRVVWRYTEAKIAPVLQS
jgi:hypothetical protein